MKDVVSMYSNIYNLFPKSLLIGSRKYYLLLNIQYYNPTQINYFRIVVDYINYDNLYDISIFNNSLHYVLNGNQEYIVTSNIMMIEKIATNILFNIKVKYKAKILNEDLNTLFDLPKIVMRKDKYYNLHIEKNNNFFIIKYLYVGDIPYSIVTYKEKSIDLVVSKVYKRLNTINASFVDATSFS